MRKKIMSALCGLISLSGFAQDSLKTTTLKEVIFSAARIDQPLLTIPRSASIITSEVIEKSVYNSVGELLSGQEGIYVVGGNQTPGMNQSVFMRGANSNQIAVLIDGKRITDPSAPNAAIDLSEISLTNVARIEVIRGSHTTMYGGAAIGGVINIITKKNQAAGFHGTASLQAGTFGKGTSAFTEQADLNYTFRNGLYVNGGLFNQNVNGLDATSKRDPAPEFLPYDKDDFRKTDAYIKGGYRKEKVDAYFSYKRSHQNTDIDNGSFNDDDNNYLSFTRDLFDYYAKYKINSSTAISALGSFSESLRINENDSSAVDQNGTTDRTYFKGNYTGKVQTNELQFDYQKNNITTVVGAGAYRESMLFDTHYFSNAFGFPFEMLVDYDSINTSSTTAYVFGEASYAIKNFNISVGTRVSNHSTFGNFFTYDLSPSYKFNTMLLYASLSTGYNAPSLYQLYDPSSGFNSYTTRGNNNLGAENSLSIEIGGKKEFNNGSYMTISLFQSITNNSIEYVYLWNGETSIAELDYSHYMGDTYINIAKQAVQGIEAGAKAIINNKLSLSGNLTLLQGKYATDPDDLNTLHTGPHHVQLYSNGSFLNEKNSTDNLLRRPGVTGNFQVMFAPKESLRFNAGYRYAGSRFDAEYDPNLGPFGALGTVEINDYHLFDLSALFQASKNFALSAKCENLLDEDYAEIQGFRTRGRSLYLKLLFKW